MRVLRIAHIHAPRGREGRAHTCGARWQYAIEHINANTYCLDERGGVAHSHQVARFVLGKALRNRTKGLEHDLVFFTDRIATDAKPAETLMAIRDRFVIDRSEQLDRLHAQIELHAALHDTEKRLVAARMGSQTTTRPIG